MRSSCLLHNCPIACVSLGEKPLCLQELLLILEECWASDPLLHSVPIYQASGLARRAMTIYQTYIEMMNEDIQAAFQVTHSASPYIRQQANEGRPAGLPARVQFLLDSTAAT